MFSTDLSTMPSPSVRNVSENFYKPPSCSYLLTQLVEELQGKTAYKDGKDLFTDIAERLSRIAKKEPAWSWRYVQSVKSQTVAPSKKFEHAVHVLMATMDDMPTVIANSVTVTIMAEQGSIPEGAFVMGAARRCANPSCTVTFVPNVPWRKRCPICSPKKEEK